MGTDFSRVRLDALLDYAGVELKQGAVLLDGDANEGTDIFDRRMRALAGDMLGRVVVSATTPDAFEIKAAGGDLTIGIGRLYVDGLLAECHGGVAPADQVFDSLLAERKFAKPLPYAKQPYPRPLPLPLTVPPPVLPTSGRHLVYLDVWNREVTHLEQPDLVEIAVGVEASSRIQTVWQVRVLEKAIGSGVTCSSPDGDLPPEWEVLTAPSTGVLTTDTYDIAPTADPCELPPTGGYRGLENQLYRVEIHDPGAAGAATFKWSRDNASVGSRVASIVSATELDLESLGRDDVLSFKTGDWVEIIDDVREFARQPGDIRRITVDASRRRITLASALTGDLLPLPASLPNSGFPKDRNVRVRRWDQSGPVYIKASSGPPVEIDNLNSASSKGVIKIPSATTTFILEHGVTVTLNPGAKGFRSGDYWVFAARTADASVERLVAAPPRGVHHHYARLAIWDAGAKTVTDCRPKRQAGCCTFVVRPGESIQAAIDALPPAGGCVCLKAGLHLINAPIIIRRDNVTLHGESMGAIVRCPVDRVLLVAGCREVRIASIVFQREESAQSPIVHVVRAESVVVDDCRLETEKSESGSGLMAYDTQELQVSRCVFAGGDIGAWCWGGCRDVTISGCEFRLLNGLLGIWAQTMAGPIVAEDNIVFSASNGIVVNDNLDIDPVSAAHGSRVCGNRISITGRPVRAQRAFAIDVAAEAAIVSDNHIEHDGGNFAGIRLCGSSSSARGNVIKSLAGVQPTSIAPLPQDPIAIIVGNEKDGKLLPLERMVIADNIVEGVQHGIVLVGAARSRVSGNILGGGSLSTLNGIVARTATDCIVAENVLAGHGYGILAIAGARNTISENSMEGGGFGVILASEEAPTVSGNRLKDLDRNGITLWVAGQRCNVIGNRVIRCGSGLDMTFGVGAWDILGELHVEANEVMDLGGPFVPNGPKARLAYGIAGENILEARIESNLVTYSNPAARDAGEDRALRMRGSFDFPPSAANRFGAGFAIQIANNRFIGFGASALVELFEQQISDNVFLRFDRVLFHGNYCVHFNVVGAAPTTSTAGQVRPATVKLVGRHCSVTGNHVRATMLRFPSYLLLDTANAADDNNREMRGPFIGNVSHSGHSGRVANEMPDPESSFNTNA